jgi:hypothetical protein
MAGPLITFPPKPEGYTVEDVLALPGRIELIDGSLSLGTDLTVVQAVEAYPNSTNVELVEGPASRGRRPLRRPLARRSPRC